MRTCASFVFTCAVLSALVGCGGGGGSSSPRPTPTPTPAADRTRVEVTASAARAGVGDPIALTATYYDSGGNPYPGFVPEWSVDAPTRASVSRSGSFIGMETGEITVSAKMNGVSGTKRLTVSAGTGSWSGPTFISDKDPKGWITGENATMDAQNNLYVAGTALEVWDGEKFPGPKTAALTRYLPNGKRAWTRAFSETGAGGANGIALRPSGGAYVSNTTSYYSHLFCVDATGRLVWNRQVAGAGITDLTSDRAGNIYAVGSIIRSQISAVQRTFPDARRLPGDERGNDGFLAKFAPDGAPLWIRLFAFEQGGGYTLYNDPTGVAVDETRGNIFVSSTIQPGVDPALFPTLARFSLADGALQWHKSIGLEGISETISDRYYFGGINGSAKDSAHCVTVDGEGNAWVGMNYAPGNTSNTEAALVKVSPDARELLRREMVVERGTGGLGNELAVFGLAYRAARNQVVALVPTGGTFLRRVGATDATVVGLNLSGDEAWRERITTASLPGGTAAFLSVNLRSLTVSNSGDIFVAGDTGDLRVLDGEGDAQQQAVAIPLLGKP
jgi:hypothetical protein